MIKRIIQRSIESVLFGGKAIIILGPRQTGKTTLVQTLLTDKNHLFLNADDAIVQKQLADPDSFRIRQIIGDHNIVFIDEVQRLQQPGITMKLITDQFKQVQLIASGSSALEIRHHATEPLTGRKWEYHLYPISWQELEASIGYLEAEKQLAHRLIYGMYPDVINNPGRESQVLQQLTLSYLYKDILALSGIRKPDLLERLLQALALQMSNEVSYTELSQLLQVDKDTIVSYIDLLEKAFIIFRLRSFSSNQRNEIKNNRKIYFWDNGIRNMVIANLNPVDLRQDKGALWENFLVTERLKMLQYHQLIANSYFWRTTLQQEIDYVEEKNGTIQGYEFKWKAGGRKKTPAAFFSSYGTTVTVISRDNFREFIFYP
ncbi:MAG: ATP-binding protein [Saprospiraceae bacterium]|nr:ATP-binding protein [Saprospiraceae bacterium]